MNFLTVQRILGLLLMLFSVTMLPPVAVGLYYRDGHWQPFLESFGALVVVGALIWWPARKAVRDLRARDGFLVVSMFWIVLGLAGAVPLLISDKPELTLTDAVFEAVSGFTTTGATVIVGLENLPISILYFRQQIQWLGGIGIVVLAVALLPMLGVGGMQLLKAESPRPTKDARLTPRITETAKALWAIYVALTVLCAVCYWMAGMTPFDAIAHSFSTVSTGGHSTHDASIGYFDNVVVEMVACVFMFLGSVNFALHFFVLRHRRVQDYLRDPEFRAFVTLVVGLFLLTVLMLTLKQVYTPEVALRTAMFQAVSTQTGTGFFTTDYSLWPGALPVILLLMTFISGSAGSTSGGMKVIRWLLIWKQGMREVQRLIHPSAEIPVRIGSKPIDWRIIDSVWGFFAAYVILFGVLMVLMMISGADQVTAFSAIAACMTNYGVGLGDVSSNFSSISDLSKWLCVIAMLLGRLEIFPLLVIATPSFWRR
ncbi:potassium transporter [Steroidobacter sp. S1-65]|uniref:Trk system potassium uptake protein n=1 Tax=Steroidobacter gossypii TaxID=2805490 RepID=A0ABS1WT37_9GAMM|nr:TrkH family potassium uptake protein [Steroidobacter gossypii]MBM0104146.1 potassium transporter [Steroidobacter gossypii]